MVCFLRCFFFNFILLLFFVWAQPEQRLLSCIPNSYANPTSNKIRLCKL